MNDIQHQAAHPDLVEMHERTLANPTVKMWRVLEDFDQVFDAALSRYESSVNDLQATFDRIFKTI